MSLTEQCHISKWNQLISNCYEANQLFWTTFPGGDLYHMFISLNSLTPYCPFVLCFSKKTIFEVELVSCTGSFVCCVGGMNVIFLGWVRKKYFLQPKRKELLISLPMLVSVYLFFWRRSTVQRLHPALKFYSWCGLNWPQNNGLVTKTRAGRTTKSSGSHMFSHHNASVGFPRTRRATPTFVFMESVKTMIHPHSEAFCCCCF